MYNYRKKTGLIFLFIGVCSALSPTYLTPADKEHLKQVLDPAWSLSDISQVLYASGGYKHLGLEVPDKQNVCNFIKNSIKDKPTIENLYFASSAGNALSCPISPPSNARQMLSEVLREGSSPQELYYAVSALTNLGLEVDSPKALRAISQALKKDDSVLSLGYAFHIGSQLKGDVLSIFERIEDAIVQADEVDGFMLQFEGGLSITALVLSGAYKLAETSKKAIPIKPEQIIKFSNYLMSRKSVQMAKGVYYLLDAVLMLTNNKFHVPVAITLSSSVAISFDSPQIQVRATNLLGADLPNLKLTAISALDQTTGKSILANKQLKPVSKPVSNKKSQESLYELDVMGANPPRGFYKLSINAEGSDNRLVGNLGAALTFKVLSAVSLHEVEIGTADSDQSTPPSLKKVPYPSKLPSPLEADQHQRLLLRFTIKDSASGKATRVHQSFVKVTHAESKREIIFVAEADAGEVYKFDMDVTGKRKEFGGVSGKYFLELIIGDASISNPLVWPIAEVVLSFPDGVANAMTQDFTYKPLSEIRHLFRSPDPRPPQVVSLAFTALSLSPLLVLLGCWAKLGINISNFPVSLNAIGFHGGLGGMFALFCVFWWELNMFTTLRYLTCVGVVTFFCGNSMLSSIAGKRKEQEVKLVYGSYYQKAYRFSHQHN